MTITFEKPSAPASRRAPVRVLHVVHCLGSDGRTGGMEYGVIKVVNGIDRARVQPAICSTRVADPAIVGLLAPGVEYFECDGRRRGNDPRLVMALRRTFQRFRPDVVHTHAWGTLVEGVLAAALARVPVVVHGEHGTMQTRWHQRLVQRVVWGRVDQVLSVSSVLASRLGREIGFDPERILTIRNGVDTDRFDPALRSASRLELGLGGGEILIGTVGRLVEVKNQALLVTAFAAVARERPEARLLLAGDGPLRGELLALARTLGVDAQLRLLGHRPDVERVLAALDVFVLSSHSEGLSNTILEAMASGVPVVATDVGGARELVVDGESGLLTPAGDAGALASAIGTLIGDADVRTGMACAARERALSEFSITRMIDAYTRLYERLADRTAASHKIRFRGGQHQDAEIVSAPATARGAR